MTNQEMRNIVEQLDINLFKINYKTGVHYGVIEDFFGGKTDDMNAVDREKIEKMLEKEVQKAEKAACACGCEGDIACPICQNKKALSIAAGVVAGIAVLAIVRKGRKA